MKFGNLRDTLDHLRETILASLTFGPATCDGFEPNDDCPADGGVIYTTVPVFVHGRKIGRALLGAHVHTEASRGGSYDDRAEVHREGYAICQFRDTERHFQYELNGASWCEVLGLDAMETEALNCWKYWELEDLILDAASRSEIDYEGIFRAALLARLAETSSEDTYSLMQAVRGLYHNAIYFKKGGVNGEKAF